jgi:large subunit ribosomal protein L6
MSAVRFFARYSDLADGETRTGRISLMSRIGKKPVAMPSGVSASVEGQTLTVKGPKGTLSMAMLDDLVAYTIEDGAISIKPLTQAQRNRAAWGMQRTQVQNLVTGVTEGFTKVLEINGVGYRAAIQGSNLKLQLGYSHDVNFAVPEGIDVKTPDATTVEISGIDKQQVGQVAAEIRRWRKPEPYKGKGIKYRGEFIFRKEGKKK